MVELEATDKNLLWLMPFTGWITKATDTHTDKYLIRTGCPQQQLFPESASLLRHTYIAPLVFAKRLHHRSAVDEELSKSIA
jgi:hypothetical protein